MYLNIQDSITHIKSRKINVQQRTVIEQLESLYIEICETRIELNKSIGNLCPVFLKLRKKVLIRLINIRNLIRKSLIDNFHVQLNTANARYVTECIQKPKWYGEFDSFVLSESEHLCKIRKSATGLEWHIDHMIPLKGRNASGLHCGLNFQVIPAYINLLKNNKHICQEPFEWIIYI